MNNRSKEIFARLSTRTTGTYPHGKLAERGAKLLGFALLFGLVLFATTPAQAQLFGSSQQRGNRRSSGNSLNPNAVQANQDSGTVRGTERFLRQNRRRGDFVGSDRFDRRTFVGSQQGQASGQAIPSTLGVRQGQDRTSQINQPLPRPPKNQAYYPRLQFDATTFGSTPANGINGGSLQIGTQLQRELENPDYFSSSNRLSLRLEGRTAILRGVVADPRQRELVELFVSFEPGVSAVRNELDVAHEDARSTADGRSTADANSELPPPKPTPSPLQTNEQTSPPEVVAPK